jgi:hypothetical protein
LDDSLQNLTDAQLFGAYRDLIERGGRDDVLVAVLEADGEKQLASAVRVLAGCQTASELMAVGY